MKLAVWLGFAMLQLAWTGSIWVAAEVTRWAGETIASGAAVDWAVAAGAIQLPGWITWWISPALIESVIDGVLWALETMGQLLPWFSSVAGWLVALLWLLWGGGTALLLLVAGGLHLLLSQRARKAPDSAQN